MSLPIYVSIYLTGHLLACQDEEEVVEEVAAEPEPVLTPEQIKFEVNAVIYLRT